MMLTAAFLKMAQNTAWANTTRYQAATWLSQNGLLDPVPEIFPNLGQTLGVAPSQLDDFYLIHGHPPTAQDYWP